MGGKRTLKTEGYLGAMSFEDPTDDELRILAVLVGVCGQYMPGSFTYVEHTHMSAGEHAVHLLGRYGLVVRDGAGGAWTTKANLLERLDDVDLSNMDEIRSQFRALPDGELLSVQPGDRPHQHDVQLDLLRMWFPARAIDKHIDRPAAFGRPGPDRLDVEARLDLGDATATVRGEILTLGEICEFRNQLAQLITDVIDRAELLAYKQCLHINLWAAPSGEISGRITIANPMYHHSTSAEVTVGNRNTLRATIDQLDQVLAKFPA